MSTPESAIDRFLAACASEEDLRHTFLASVRFGPGGQHDIATLCAVSRAFNRIAAAYLFRHPELDPTTTLAPFRAQLDTQSDNHRLMRTLRILPPRPPMFPLLCPLAVEYFAWTTVSILGLGLNMRSLALWTPKFLDDVHGVDGLRSLEYLGIPSTEHRSQQGRRTYLPTPPRGLFPHLIEVMHTIQPAVDAALIPDCPNGCNHGRFLPVPPY
ncbi:hypothetical protein V8E36_007373 [Tilletia maclaganii]